MASLETKGQDRVQSRTLTAPADGALQELAVRSVGGVVEPGQTLMRIAPSGAKVEVEGRKRAAGPWAQESDLNELGWL